MEQKSLTKISALVASDCVSQTEALSVHFSSRKKVRLQTIERDKERGAERIDEQRGRRFQSDVPINGRPWLGPLVALTRGRKRSWRWEELKVAANGKIMAALLLINFLTFVSIASFSRHDWQSTEYLADGLKFFILFIVASKQETPITTHSLSSAMVTTNHNQIQSVTNAIQIVLLQLWPKQTLPLV